MGIVIGAVEFDGLHFDLDMLNDEPGIVVVLCELAGEYELLEMNEVQRVRDYMVNHPHRQSWTNNRLALAVAVHYTGQVSPWRIKELRASLEREFDFDVAA